MVLTKRVTTLVDVRVELEQRRWGDTFFWLMIDGTIKIAELLSKILFLTVTAQSWMKTLSPSLFLWPTGFLEWFSFQRKKPTEFDQTAAIPYWSSDQIRDLRQRIQRIVWLVGRLNQKWLSSVHGHGQRKIRRDFTIATWTIYRQYAPNSIHSGSNWLIRITHQRESARKMWHTIMHLRRALRFRFDESQDVEERVLTDSFF